MEMTGLDPNRHVTLEIATIITDADLQVIAEGPVIAVRRTQEELDRIDDWSLKTHMASGLLTRVEASSIDVAEAERLTLDFVRQWVAEKEAPLSGNSVHQDRLFLAREMPALESYLNYRIVDVSSVKELVKRWYPNLPTFQKKGNHLALDDIRESIEELKLLPRTRLCSRGRTGDALTLDPLREVPTELLHQPVGLALDDALTELAQLAHDVRVRMDDQIARAFARVFHRHLYLHPHVARNLLIRALAGHRDAHPRIVARVNGQLAREPQRNRPDANLHRPGIGAVIVGGNVGSARYAHANHRNIGNECPERIGLRLHSVRVLKVHEPPLDSDCPPAWSATPS